jgi:RNA polymerase sigma-70 factor (ECF subfamily)
MIRTLMLSELNPDSAQHGGESASAGSTSARRLLEQARRGSRSAIDTLFTGYRSWLRRRSRGRLPPWARDGIDTSDVVQDALHQTFARLESFESKHARALQGYLLRAVENRIHDQSRRAMRRLNVIMPDASALLSDSAAPQHQQFVNDETRKRYASGLERLTDRDRRLIVGRAELGYSYRQIAFVEGLSSEAVARKALARALRRLVDSMSNA